MAYLVKADLASHIYIETIDEITRADDTLVDKAINAGIAEAKSYLNKYNLALLFGDAPEPDDENLKNKTKDLICMHLIKVSNSNINYEVIKNAYDDAISKFFVYIMKGQLDPQGWPYREDDADTDYNEGGTITWISNPKRTNIF